MKIFNLNISIKLDNIDAVIPLISEQDADIVTLQEVTQGMDETVHERFKKREAIDAALGDRYPHRAFGALYSSYAQQKRDFGGLLEQGNYVLSKFPIMYADNRFFHRSFEHIDDWSAWRETDHARAVQVIDIMTPHGLLKVLNVHGIWTANKVGDERTQRECEFIADAAGAGTTPTIIIGDFNLLPDSPSLAVLNAKWKNLNSAFGITTTRPRFEDALESGETMVDYAFVNEYFKVSSYAVIETDLSDHLPLVLEGDID